MSRRLPPSWVLAAVLAAIYLIVDPPSADLAAQTYRTGLFEHAGFVVWDNGWYAGHHNPAYSILFPPLAAWTSPQLVGAISAVVSAWAFERIVGDARGARPASYWFATATLVSLVTGRLTFALGLALALLAVLALKRDRLVWCGIAGALSALASPVAAAFLALALVAWWWSQRRTLATALLLAAALVPALALSVLFPEGGSFPFTLSAFLPTLAGTLLVIAVLWRSASRTLRAGLVLYALLLLASEALSTPMGGNAVRLGAILAGPLAALTLWPDRRRALALLVVPLVYWQVATPIDDVWRARSDDSVHASYYDGLLTFVKGEQAAHGPFRIEIPFTDNHWESARVAPTVPLARGWERQLDRKVNGLFYDGRPLTPARYRAWLDENAVRYVALADAPVDYSAAEEAKLVRDGAAPYLREVWHDPHWKVFAVDRPAALADGGARVTAIDADRVDLISPRPSATVHLRVRWSPYWHLTRGAGCVVKDGDWTALRLTRPGPVRISAGFALDRVRATAPRCTS
ncbi:hypothetical protein DSM104299_00343 [Baekduia alba]|uniref:hypothetical protein n=1 Tax=Baekduia alba TaxID=2997333 RepID=UPI002341F781|nr:hypothetical protein [Baekduia alba]WCB91670.1 hypothetical protein DSM104299_00343 [Baekduia alba]